MSDDATRLEPLGATQMEELEEAVASYEQSLTLEAVKYLTGRGLGKAEVQKARLGIVSSPLHGHGRQMGMIAIPYLDKDGRPLSLRFRCIEEHDHRAFSHGKYGSLKDEETRMFNVAAIFRADEEIHVTEGEFDALILNKIGLPAVAIPGVNNWKWRHSKMLAGFSRIYVWGDPDQAGMDFTRALTKKMKRAKGVRLKHGDVTDTYMSGGAAALYAAIGREEPK